MAKRRALLLDFDGTVVDSVEIAYRCLDATVREKLGISFPRQVFEDHLGLPLRETFALAGPELVACADELIATYRARQHELAGQVQPFDGIVDVLRALRAAGVRIAIVTTKLRRIAARQMEAVGIDHYFDVVIGFEDYTAAKPDPEPFRLALRALDTDATDAAAAGDTPHDILGARAAGVFSVGALWSGIGRPQLIASAPDRLAESPADLLEVALG